MAITRIKNSSIRNRTPKYNDVLAGLPFRPVIGTASDGGNGTSASVAFTPNNFANGTITYTALSSPGSFTGTGTASPITVSGLTAGTAYTFQVKAGNSLGDSAYSAASNSVTPVTPSSFDSIATATGTGSSGTITFSSIPSTYQHLQIRILGRNTAAANSARSAKLRFNSDSGTNYNSYHSLFGNGSTVSAESFGTVTDTNGYAVYCFTSSDTDFASASGVAIIDIHDYLSTSKTKTVRVFGGWDRNGQGRAVLNSFFWNSTSAISSITLNTDGSNWTSDSTFALYGIRG